MRPSHPQPRDDFEAGHPVAVAHLHQTALQIVHEMPTLPLPGSGQTLERWRHLASFAKADVCLVKLLEAHYDAQAVLAELGEEFPTPGPLLAMWAAEPPDARVEFKPDIGSASGCGTLTGVKAWCSGAHLVDEALVTADAGGRKQLVRVRLSEAEISHDDSLWHAVGMARVTSGRVHFSDVPALAVGAPDAYLDRPGFWHGGAGIAACWWGVAVAIAEPLRCNSRVRSDVLMAAHLGAIDVALSAVRDVLVQTANAIDAAPALSHQWGVMRLRSLAEQVCSDVIERVGRALGPGPLCTNRAHAQRCADLGVFLRQSHAERDWVAIGRALAESENPWNL